MARKYPGSILIIAFLLTPLLGTLLAGCRAESGSRGRPSINEAVSDEQGKARVESSGGAVEFETLSGKTGERLPGVEVQIVSFGDTRFVYATDPSGSYLSVAAPLDAGSTVRRLNMPPRSDAGYNFATATGTLLIDDLNSLEILTEDDLRTRLKRGPDEAVLIYIYNPISPLALTGAALEAYAPPALDGVTILRAPAEERNAALGYVIVSLTEEAFDEWEHKNVDRYITGRIGQPPVTDLRGDLTFGWAYPVFDVFPDGDIIEVGEQDSMTLRISWRSQYPDPPPPWSFVVTTSDEDRLEVDPESFPLDPASPPQEVTINVDRLGLQAGEYSGTLFIQPYSDAFGLVEQTIEREITFTVGMAPPTPTPSPSTDLAIRPAEPREGDSLAITASGFEPNEPILIELIGASDALRDARPAADSDGNFTHDFDLTGAVPGNYTLTVTGSISGIIAETDVRITETVADAIVNTRELNLRIGPAYEYPAVNVLSNGEELTVIGVNNDDTWLEVVTITGQSGWVVADLVEINIDLSTVPWNPNVPPLP